jgi:3-methyladenine DNA glycosylase AlkD
MSTSDDLYQEIIQYCEQNTNPANIQKYSRYFVEGYDAYGLDQKPMEEQRKIWWKKYHPLLSRQQFFDLAEKLAASGKYEQISFGFWWVKQFEKEFDAETFDYLARWFDRYVINWAHSDMISMDLLPQFLTRNIISLEEYSSWAVAESRWRRRGCAVGLIKPVVKAGLDIHAALEVIRPEMLAPEKVVHQGLGWFLRDSWKIHPQVVEPFLLEYKDDCARLIIQYATEKMTAEQKAAYKRDKK